jgi:hypothetical protein
MQAHLYTQELLKFGDWQVLAVTGEHASNAPAFREQSELTA